MRASGVQARGHVARSPRSADSRAGGGATSARPDDGTRLPISASEIGAAHVHAAGPFLPSESTGAARPVHGIRPETFSTSRLLDFSSERELTAQIGHPPDMWPLVVVKELIDNSLDAAEENDVAPRVKVRVIRDAIEVRDKGPGIPGEVVDGVLDFMVRVSNREAYAGPTRGAQGNALKTLLAMPFALDGNAGQVEIHSLGVRYRIRFAVDHIGQKPVVSVRRDRSLVNNGSVVRLHWPRSPRSNLSDSLPAIQRQLYKFALLNPHLNLAYRLGGDEEQAWEATDPGWQRWQPSDPAPAHWYDVPRLERLVAAMIHADRQRDRIRTVRELVAGFRGLSGTAKQKTILAELGLARASLESLIDDEGKLDRDLLERLLAAMRAESKAPKAEALGVIGRDHIIARLDLGEVGQNSFQYRKLVNPDPLNPQVVEMAFAFDEDLDGRVLHCGLNHSPALSDAGAFRMLGVDGLGGLLRKQRVEEHHAVVLMLHMAGARLAFTDRGKSSLAWPYWDDLNRDAVEGFTKITDAWRKQVQREERDANARARRTSALTKQRTVSAKEAAWEVMKKAYMFASDNGRLPATARQVMYAARDDIQERTGKKLSDTYFTKTLLPQYIAERENECENWDIVWESRGTFNEPHTDLSVPVGTLEVRKYLADRGSYHLPAERIGGRWRTQGPQDRFGAVVYLEKEGFWPLFRDARLEERFDIALMSSKGSPTTEARKLIDALAAEGVPTFCVRDFDIKGFEIAGTLCSDTWRYSWRSGGAIDFGLRLDDVRAWGLSSEEVFHKGPGDYPLDPVNDRAAILAKIGPQLRKHGATEEEIEFLVSHRVELNSFSSDRMLKWIEGKLEAHGVKKVIPAETTLLAAARGFALDAVATRYMKLYAADIAREVDAFDPGDIEAAVADLLAENPEMPWDDAVEQIVRARILA